jgi:hypothetical protein
MLVYTLKELTGRSYQIAIRLVYFVDLVSFVNYVLMSGVYLNLAGRLMLINACLD